MAPPLQYRELIKNPRSVKQSLQTWNIEIGQEQISATDNPVATVMIRVRRSRTVSRPARRFSITEIRDYVKKRKVSGGTRSDEGRQCRDTFASFRHGLLRTCETSF